MKQCKIMYGTEKIQKIPLKNEIMAAEVNAFEELQL
jgi:hypothetical protein